MLSIHKQSVEKASQRRSGPFVALTYFPVCSIHHKAPVTILDWPGSHKETADRENLFGDFEFFNRLLDLPNEKSGPCDDGSSRQREPTRDATV